MIARLVKELKFGSGFRAERSGLVAFDIGTTVPSGTAGYEVGAIFMHSDGGAGTAIYVNEGTSTSCSFTAIAGTELSTDELAAINGAAAPAAGNVFATMADVAGASSALAVNKIYIGSAGGAATAQTMGGDATIVANGTLTLTPDNIVDADIKTTAAISYSKLAALATGKIVVGNGGVPTAATLSGDATIDAAGALTIAAGAVESSMLASALDPSKFTLADGTMLVGNGSNAAAAVTMSGDVTITNAGVAAIAAGVIVDNDVNAAAAIALSKLGADDLGSFTGAVVPGTDAILIVDGGTLKSSTYQVIMDGIDDLTAFSGAVAPTTDKVLFDDAGTAKAATYQVFADGLDDLTAKAAVAAVADKIVITDSAASGVAKNITVQYLFDVLGDLTDLGAAPAADDRIAVTDESAGGDPAKSITVQNLFDGIAGLTDFSGAVVPGTDQIFLDDGGTVKRATVQELFDGLNDLTALAAAPDLTDSLFVDDAGTAKKITVQYVLDAVGNVANLGAVPAADDRVVLTDESAAGEPAVSTTIENLLSVIGDVTALTGTPAIDDRMIITDENVAGDPCKSVTMQEVMDSAAGLTDTAIANGDSIIFLDGGTTAKIEAIADVATLFAGGGLTATNSVLAVCDTVWPMAVFGTWTENGDGAETNGAGFVGDVTLTEAAAAFCVGLDGASAAIISTISGEAGYTANYQMFPDIEADDDAVYFGGTVPFCEIAVNLSQLATYDAASVIDWEYYNGSTWTALTISYDATDTSDQSGARPFQQVGAISFVPPTNWAAVEVNSQSAYWIRAAIATGKAANITQIPILNSKEHEIVTPTDGFTVPAAGTINNVRAVDAATTLHTTKDIKFIIMNYTTGAHSGELTWAQDQRSDKWNISGGLTVADGDELGVLVTQEDTSNEALNVMLELEVTLS